MRHYIHFAISLIDAIMSSNNKCDIALCNMYFKDRCHCFLRYHLRTWGNSSTIHIPTSDFQNVCFLCISQSLFIYASLDSRGIVHEGSLTIVTHVSVSIQAKCIRNRILFELQIIKQHQDTHFFMLCRFLSLITKVWNTLKNDLFLWDTLFI